MFFLGQLFYEMAWLLLNHLCYSGWHQTHKYIENVNGIYGLLNNMRTWIWERFGDGKNLERVWVKNDEVTLSKILKDVIVKGGNNFFYRVGIKWMKVYNVTVICLVNGANMMQEK